MDSGSSACGLSLSCRAVRRPRDGAGKAHPSPDEVAVVRLSQRAVATLESAGLPNDGASVPSGFALPRLRRRVASAVLALIRRLPGGCNVPAIPGNSEKPNKTVQIGAQPTG